MRDIGKTKKKKVILVIILVSLLLCIPFSICAIRLHGYPGLIVLFAAYSILIALIGGLILTKVLSSEIKKKIKSYAHWRIFLPYPVKRPRHARKPLHPQKAGPCRFRNLAGLLQF